MWMCNRNSHSYMIMTMHPFMLKFTICVCDDNLKLLQAYPTNIITTSSYLSELSGRQSIFKKLSLFIIVIPSPQLFAGHVVLYIKKWSWSEPRTSQNIIRVSINVSRLPIRKHRQHRLSFSISILQILRTVKLVNLLPVSSWNIQRFV